MRERGSHARELATIMSVVPLTMNGQDYLMLAIVPTFAQDFGAGGFDSHSGDTEAYAMFFLRQGQEYRWVTTTHKGHWSFGSGPSYGWYHKQTFRDDGIPQISVEQDKHGVWPTTKHCNNESWLDCGGGDAWRRLGFNVGDYASGSGETLSGNWLIDNISLHPVLGQQFPGEFIWDYHSARQVPTITGGTVGKFCGGWQDCHSGSTLHGQVIRSLVRRAEGNNWVVQPKRATHAPVCTNMTGTTHVRDYQTAVIVHAVL